jgi:Asp-tRNA(Asn)/Glu-tRNA(Gln) amidotransferase A subunit family amidase
MLHWLSVREMAAQIRGRQISPLELVEAHLRRIEQINPSINAFSDIFSEQAREAAMRPLEGPLHGVPITIKDSFDIAGLPTRCGSRLRNDHIAGRDATAVAKLRRAGAILIGKTNVPELAGSYETDNYVTGRTVNPWDAGRTPGGSSGGEAAAIASGCSPGGLGSDGGGSIRVPAHFCGIAGFKPTVRRISGAGHFPPCAGPSALVSTPGPMARSVADLRLLFDIMQGADDRDSLAIPRPAAHASLPGRIGLVRRFYQTPVHPAIAEALDRAAALFVQSGFGVDEIELRGLERAPNVWAFFFVELGRMHTRQFLAGRESEAHWTLLEFYKETPPPDAAAVYAQYAERERLRAATLEQMADYPILLMPPCSTPAFAHRERRYQIGEASVSQFAAMAPATTWNLLGFPALVLPCGLTAEGLPVGVQIVGRPFEDERVLEAGERLEQQRGPFPFRAP